MRVRKERVVDNARGDSWLVSLRGRDPSISSVNLRRAINRLKNNLKKWKGVNEKSSVRTVRLEEIRTNKIRVRSWKTKPKITLTKNRSRYFENG